MGVTYIETKSISNSLTVNYFICLIEISYQSREKNMTILFLEDPELPK